MMRLLSRSKFFLVSLGLLLLFLFAVLCWFLFIPPSGTTLTKTVFIKKGSHLKRVSEALEQEGIIKNRHLFVLLTEVLGKKTKIRAGEYDLHTRMLPYDVLNTLIKGQSKQHLVTIPEGYTLAQIAQLLEDLNLVEKEGFLQKASSPALITLLGLPESAGKTLEGYLFPETYDVLREMEPEELIQKMVHQFKKVFGPDLIHRASEQGLTEREAVILASVIEKETSLPEEKSLVSAVFHNRLKRNIPLQSDPTVIYGIKNFDGNLTKEHLLTKTPYNTYLIAGLPPTPICNPGKESLYAAVNPAPVPYLYFVSKNDGSHYFSSEIEDHNRAVWKYQKFQRKKTVSEIKKR